MILLLSDSNVILSFHPLGDCPKMLKLKLINITGKIKTNTNRYCKTKTKLKLKINPNENHTDTGFYSIIALVCIKSTTTSNPSNAAARVL